MPVQWRTEAIPFAGGIDTKTAKALLPHGKFRRLENCYQEKTGEIRKRPAFKPLKKTVISGISGETADQITRSSGILTHGEELLLAADHRLLTRSSALNAWHSKGDYTDLRFSSRTVWTGDVAETTANRHGARAFAAVDNIAVIAGVRSFQDSGNAPIAATVIDLNTGAEIQSNRQLYSLSTSNTFTIRAMSVGRNIVVVVGYGTGTGGLIRAHRFNIDSHVWDASPSTLVDGSPGVTGVASISACAVGGDQYCIAYCADTSLDLKLETFNLSHVSQNTATITRTNAVAYSEIIYDDVADILYVVDAETSDKTRVEGRDSTLSSVFSSTTFDTFILNAPPVLMLQEDQAGIYAAYQITSAGNGYLKRAFVSAAGSVSGAKQLLPFSEKFTPMCGVWRQDGYYYFPMIYEGNTADGLQKTVFIARDNNGTTQNQILEVVGRFLVSEAYSGDHRGIFHTGDRVYFPISRRSRVIRDGVPETQVILMTAEHSKSQPQSVSVNGTTFLSGGILYQYDGNAVSEAGFHLYPDGISTALVASGSCDDGLHSVLCLYSVVDDNGNLTLSKVLGADSETCGSGNNKIRVTFPLVNITGRDHADVQFFMTKAGGSTYYNAGSYNNASVITASSTSGTATFDIDISDSDLESNPTLYTTGGVLANDAIPSPSYFASALGRLFVVPGDIPQRIWPSHVLGYGAAPAFSGLTILSSPTGGEFISCEEMDGSLVVFLSDRIFRLAGEGPNTLAQGSFSRFFDIKSDVGTIKGSRLLPSSAGIFFQSRRGLHLLGRDLSVSDLSEVDDLVAGKTIYSTLIDPVRDHSYFLTDDNILALNTRSNSWSVYPVSKSTGIVSWQGKLCYGTPSGDVMVESPGEYCDAGTVPYSMQVETSDFQFGGIAGFQRVRGFILKGEYRSPHDLEVDLYYDGDASLSETITIPHSKIVKRETGGSYEVEIRPSRQKCSSVRLAIRDKGQSGSCESARFTAIVVEFATLGRTRRKRARD